VESAQFRNEQGMGTHEVEEPVATDFDAVPGEIFPYQPMEFSSSGALGNIRTLVQYHLNKFLILRLFFPDRFYFFVERLS
jgi:hypothetical protein